VEEQQIAEGRRGGELWQEMIQRQRQEKGDRDSSAPERYRSLPDEKEKEKGRSLWAPQEQQEHLADNSAWQQQLMDAAQRAGHQQHELER
jgi:hypothetical protein